MKSTAYIVKTSIISALLILESFAITGLMASFVESGQYFNPSWTLLLKITLLMLLAAYTYALSVGHWRKWEQYVVLPLVISLGIALRVLLIDSTYAILLFVGTIIFLTYDTWIATGIKNQLIKFNPRVIFRNSTRGLFFVYALTCATLVLIDTQNVAKINIGKTVGKIAEDQVKNIIASQLPSADSYKLFDEVGNIPLPASELSLLLPSPDINKLVEDEINNVITPYRNFVAPLIALLAFALIRFLGTFARTVFNLTIGGIFWAALKTGFLKEEKITVEQQLLKF